MATDSVARILAMAALEGSGSGGGKQVESAYVDEDGHLHLVYQDGTDMDVGRVMGKVFAPSIIHDSDGRVILHWDLKEDATEVPEDIFLRMERAEWTDVPKDQEGDQYSDIYWNGISFTETKENNINNNINNEKTKGFSTKEKENSDYVWGSI